MASSIQQLLLSTIPASEIGTLFSVALTLDSDGWSGYTGVERIAASAMTLPSGSITKVRFRLVAAASEGITIGNAYVGHRAGSGDEYDFSAAPVQVLFGGSAGVTISAGSTKTSDWATFSYNKTSDLLFAFYCSGSGSSDAPKYASGITDVADYEKIANDAATVNKTGYSTNTGYITLVDLVECDGF